MTPKDVQAWTIPAVEEKQLGHHRGCTAYSDAAGEHGELLKITSAY